MAPHKYPSESTGCSKESIVSSCRSCNGWHLSEPEVAENKTKIVVNIISILIILCESKQSGLPEHVVLTVLFIHVQVLPTKSDMHFYGPN